jgi:hypothetical protein
MEPNLSLDVVHKKVYESAKAISDEQNEVWKMSEWNICHHLAIELGKRFDGYNIDVELVKDDKRRPDIVIHRRGEHENNLVVFQVKIKPSHKDIADDLQKIEETFFRDPYNYKYGIILSVGKLPEPLQDFNTSKIRFVQVSGAVLMTDEEYAKKKKQFEL